MFVYKKFIFEQRHTGQHEEWQISHWTVFGFKKYIFEHRQKITWRMKYKPLYSVCLQKVHIEHRQKITWRMKYEPLYSVCL